MQHNADYSILDTRVEGLERERPGGQAFSYHRPASAFAVSLLFDPVPSVQVHDSPNPSGSAQVS